MTEWTSLTQPPRTDSTAPVRGTVDSRFLVLDNRGFWIAVNINKSVPSWKEK
jgi:hypothetical protein